MSKERKCNTCEYFSHALEAMTDHVDYHSCVFYDRKIDFIYEVKECKMYKPKEKE